jgi:hypothetical protein
MSHTVTVYRNDTTREFSVSARPDGDPAWRAMRVKEASRGHVATEIATGLARLEARHLKSNTITSFELAGYTLVPREALAEGAVY